MPSRPASARSGDGRGAAMMTGVPAARNDRAIAARIVDLPDLGGPATMNAGTPSPRSGPHAVSSSPPTPTRPHSGPVSAAGRSRHASAKVILDGRTSTRNGRRDAGTEPSRSAHEAAISRSAAA